jgi:hypothetical protein
MNDLKQKGCVGALVQNQDVLYYLTELGRNIGREYISDADEDLIQKVAITKKYNNEISLKNLLRETYLEYPEFAKRSIIAKDVTYESVNLKELPKIKDGPGFVASVLSEKREISLKGDAARLFLKLISE